MGEVYRARDASLGPRGVLLAGVDERFIRGTLAPDGRHIIASRGRLLRDTFTIRGFQ
jgi:hypothetical protein